MISRVHRGLWKHVALVLIVGSMPPAALLGQNSNDESRRRRSVDKLLAGEFLWKASGPLVAVNAETLPPSENHPWVAVKDPSIVRYQDRWHLFCSLRRQKSGQGRIRIGYLSFADWKDAAEAKWHLLELSMDYHGAPQIFYFRPHKKWYLVYQLEDKARGIPYGPCYSTTDQIADPSSWTQPAPFYKRKPEGRPAGLDFWIVCDEDRAHLFFTSLNGQMWRAAANLLDFPNGFEEPRVVLRGDVFEASHTYRLRGLDKYLTLIEAQGKSGGRGHRYYKAYIADQLDGEWKELAASANKPFAGSINVRVAKPRWTDSFSHGELLRAGYDERLEVDPANLKFVFQGLADENWGRQYGRLSWRLGLLEPLDNDGQ